jgi:hypothetical protein
VRKSRSAVAVLAGARVAMATTFGAAAASLILLKLFVFSIDHFDFLFSLLLSERIAI